MSIDGVSVVPDVLVDPHALRVETATHESWHLQEFGQPVEPLDLTGYVEFRMFGADLEELPSSP